MIPYSLQISSCPFLEGADLKPLKLRGSEIKRERIWEFCIEMFVSLKGGEIFDFWPRRAKIEGTKIKGSGN